MLEVSEKEEDAVLLHTNWGFKNQLCWRRFKYANPVPTSSLTGDLATVPSGPVLLLPYIHDNMIRIIQSR